MRKIKNILIRVQLMIEDFIELVAALCAGCDYFNILNLFGEHKAFSLISILADAWDTVADHIEAHKY